MFLLVDGALHAFDAFRIAEGARLQTELHARVEAIGRLLNEVQQADQGRAERTRERLRTKLAELYSGDVADGIRVLYGGSVKSSNVAAIMAKEDVDGALVGGASLKADSFAAMVRSAMA